MTLRQPHCLLQSNEAEIFCAGAADYESLSACVSFAGPSRNGRLAASARKIKKFYDCYHQRRLTFNLDSIFTLYLFFYF